MSDQHPIPIDRQAWIDAGIVDPDDPEAEELLDVLEQYARHGVDPLEHAASTDPGDFFAEMNRAALNPGRRRPLAEARAELAMPPGTFDRLVEAMGLAPDEGLTDLEIEALSLFSLASSLFTEDELVRFTRVLGASMDRLAAATTSMFQIDVASPLTEEGASALDFARKNLESAQLVESVFTPLKAIFLHRLVRAGRQNDQARGTLTGSRETVMLTIGFVDVVDSTSLTDALEPDELALVMLDFEARAYRVAARHDGRIVKLIGDEVMFVCVDPDVAAAMVTGLFAEFAEAGLVPRGGLSRGEVVSRGGDVHGRAVNLAARLVGQAVPGEVLVDDGVADELDDAQVEPAGRRQLRGYREPVRVHSLKFTDEFS